MKDFNEKQLKDFFERYIALKEEIRKFREENYKVVSSKKKEFELNSIELEEKIRFEKERIKKLEETNNRINNKIQEIGEEFRKNFSGMENAFKEKIEKMDIE